MFSTKIAFKHTQKLYCGNGHYRPPCGTKELLEQYKELLPLAICWHWMHVSVLAASYEQELWHPKAAMSPKQAKFPRVTEKSTT